MAETRGRLAQAETQLFECLEDRREFGIPRKGAVAPSAQPSIFFATLPKSGTEYLWGAIRDCTDLVLPEIFADAQLMDQLMSGYCNREEIQSTGVFCSERLSLKAIRQYLPNGYAVGTHMHASYHNIRTMIDAGVSRITVLMRDPRDNTVSWTYHLRTGGAAFDNYHSHMYRMPEDYFSWSHQQQLAFQVRTFLPMAVNWIESWLHFVGRTSPDLEILIVYMDELKRAPRETMDRILQFHGCTTADLSRVALAEPGKRHFRRGEHDQWQEEFSPADKAFAASLIGDRISLAMSAAARRLPAFAAVTDAESRGDLPAALGSVIEVLRRFPASTDGYDSLCRVGQALGLDLSGLPAERSAFVSLDEELTALQRQPRSGLLRDPDQSGDPV